MRLFRSMLKKSDKAIRYILNALTYIMLLVSLIYIIYNLIYFDFLRIVAGAVVIYTCIHLNKSI